MLYTLRLSVRLPARLSVHLPRACHFCPLLKNKAADSSNLAHSLPMTNVSCVTSGGSRLPELGGQGGPEILGEGPGGLGDGSPPAGSRGRVPVGGLGDFVPQKPKHLA